MKALDMPCVTVEQVLRLRDHAIKTESQRDRLREALELVLFCDKDDVVYARTKARAALEEIDNG